MVSQTEVETPFGTRLTYSIGTESIWTEYHPSRKIPPLPEEPPVPEASANRKINTQHLAVCLSLGADTADDSPSRPPAVGSVVCMAAGVTSVSPVANLRQRPSRRGGCLFLLAGVTLRVVGRPTRAGATIQKNPTSRTKPGWWSAHARFANRNIVRRLRESQPLPNLA